MPSQANATKQLPNSQVLGFGFGDRTLLSARPRTVVSIATITAVRTPISRDQNAKSAKNLIGIDHMWLDCLGRLSSLFLTMLTEIRNQLWMILRRAVEGSSFACKGQRLRKQQVQIRGQLLL